MSTRTNPAYAHLAYRRAIIRKMTLYLREEYLPLSSDEPKQTLVCDEVFHEDAQIPPEEVLYIVEELEQEAEHLRLELGKFTFRKQDDNNGLLSSEKNKASAKKGSNQNSGGKRRP